MRLYQLYCHHLARVVNVSHNVLLLSILCFPPLLQQWLLHRFFYSHGLHPLISYREYNLSIQVM